MGSLHEWEDAFGQINPPPKSYAIKERPEEYKECTRCFNEDIRFSLSSNRVWCGLCKKDMGTYEMYDKIRRLGSDSGPSKKDFKDIKLLKHYKQMPSIDEWIEKER